MLVTFDAIYRMTLTQQLSKQISVVQSRSSYIKNIQRNNIKKFSIYKIINDISTEYHRLTRIMKLQH